ncbi:MAG: adenosylcobinamide-GDP ribazoletransferase [Lachnospiraceae bacterium]|nr:adenosylcobinamide-GDP ribazoletransferase [Lachnospiraceae bacterium]
MKIIKGLIIAFSLYSRIPMPRFEWKEEDMRYNLCFLPFVGALIGVLIYGSLYFIDSAGLPILLKICAVSVIPLIITGGFHVDGFMDVADAHNSYRSKEEKLKILKDPHIGAFAVISLLIYSLIWAGALTIIFDKGSNGILIPLAFIFVISRIGTAASSVLLKKAKDDGMLKNETNMTGNFQLAILGIEFAACVLAVGFADIYAALLMTAGLIIFYIYYRYKTYKEFGGVTGDTAGYFVCMCELTQAVILAVYCLIR